MNNINFKSLDEWKKTYPKDYVYAKNKKMLPFICDKMNWGLPKNKALTSFNELKETKLIEINNIFLEIEKEFNVIKIKNNKASAIRFRLNLKGLKKELMATRRYISLIK